MNRIRIPSLNSRFIPDLVLILILSQTFSIQIASATPSAAPDHELEISLPASIPAPCEDSLMVYAQAPNTALPDPGSVKTVSPFFGACESARSARNPSDTIVPNIPVDNPGIIFIGIDQLVRTIVEGRIHNLYLGYDGIGKPTGKTDSHLIQDPDSPSISNTGSGSCDSTGACNQFCGEGYNSTFPAFNISKVLPGTTPVPSPIAGGFGFVPFSQSTSSGRTNLFGTSLSTRVGESGLRVLASDFAAKGVIAGNAAGTPSGNLATTTPYTPDTEAVANGVHEYFSVDAVGWPKQAVSNKQHLLSCNGAIGDQDYFGSHVAMCFADTEHYQLRSITWDDGTYPQPNATEIAAGTAENCDYLYKADYSKATTMSALQAGALVQATWVALNEVYSEIMASGNHYQLYVTDQSCLVAAKQYMGNLQDASSAIALSKGKDGSGMFTRKFRQLLAQTMPMPGSGVIQNGTGNTPQQTCSPTPSDAVDHPVFNEYCSDNVQLLDHERAIMLSLQQSQFANLAACEVIARANNRFHNAFTSPEGKATVSQLKSWAATSCMQASGDLFAGETNIGACFGAGLGTGFAASIGAVSLIKIVGHVAAAARAASEMRQLGQAATAIKEGLMAARTAVITGKVAGNVASLLGAKAAMSNPFSFLAGLALMFSLTAGIVFCPSDSDTCMIDGLNASPFSCRDRSISDFKAAYLGSGYSKMGNCFPYAYSAALHDYLDRLTAPNPKNPAQTVKSFSQTPIQVSYPSVSTQKGTVSITGCQIRDDNPKFTPVTRTQWGF